MEVRGNELVDEIVLNDDEKCITGLLKVTSKANNGKDIRPFLGGIVVRFFFFFFFIEIGYLSFYDADILILGKYVYF